MRDKIGPVAAFKIALVVARLPKTRSGKILRGTMKKIADHDSWATPATIEDPKVLDEIREALEARLESGRAGAQTPAPTAGARRSEAFIQGLGRQFVSSAKGFRQRRQQACLARMLTSNVKSM